MATQDPYPENPSQELIERVKELSRGVLTPNEARKVVGLKPLCSACHKVIHIQIFQGTAWCSDDCRKTIQGGD